MSDDGRPADDGRAADDGDPADEGAASESGTTDRTVAQGQDATTETSEEGRDDEEEWRYSLDDLPIDGDDAGDEGEGIAGVFGPSKEIEPEAISRESVVFVVLGAVIALVGLYLMLP